MRDHLTNLVTNHHGGLGPIVRIDQTLGESALPVGAPVGLLRVVGLGHRLPIGPSVDIGACL